MTSVQQATIPTLLIVLDGWGHSSETKYNAIYAARTPVWDRFLRDYPHTLIQASGADVGLPEQQMGNSEVGHMHLGAGRRVVQDLTRIDEAISDRSFFDNAALNHAMQSAAASNSCVHLMALTSPGGVHSHDNHVLAAIDLAADCGVTRLAVHCFLDGRDTPPQSASESLQRLQTRLDAFDGGSISTVIGRYYAMDRNNAWDRTKIAHDLLVLGEASYHSADAVQALAMAYERGETDEFVAATTIDPCHAIADGDVVVYMNFRADRARQLTRAFIEPEFHAFQRSKAPKIASFVTLTEYSSDFAVPVAYPSTDLENTFGEYVSALGLKQLRIAETEKYAHVTFFFNGGEEQVFPGEDRVLVASPNVATYDLQPQMSAHELTEKLVSAIQSEDYSAIVCNFANPDMVGHTGVFDAAVSAVETVDKCLGPIESAAKAVGMEILITADHGNVEKMRAAAEPGGSPSIHTAHTSNLVPLVYIGRRATLATAGNLADISPTLLQIMGLEQPKQMTGRALLNFEP